MPNRQELKTLENLHDIKEKHSYLRHLMLQEYNETEINK